MTEYPVVNVVGMRPPDLGHYVYRFHDGDGLPLYVGCTGNFWRRVGDHMYQKDWWPLVSWERTILEFIGPGPCAGDGCTLPGHRAMLDREAELIRTLRPQCNRTTPGLCAKGHLIEGDNAVRVSRGAYACKQCARERHKAWRDANREHVRAESRAAERRWRLANPERAMAKGREFRAANRELLNARARSQRARRKISPGQSPLFDLPS
jgi:hypothetical protein